MENQHRKIKGYRELSQEEIDLMNEVKALGPQIAQVIAKVRSHINKQTVAAMNAREVAAAAGATEAESVRQLYAEYDRLDAAQPGRWASIAATDLQIGLMALTRAVAQPTFF